MARTAEVKRDARIGEAEARKESTMKEALAEEERMAAKYINDTQVWMQQCHAVAHGKLERALAFGWFWLLFSLLLLHHVSWVIGWPCQWWQPKRCESSQDIDSL